jgi:DNA-binding SARP family transcriptional activator
MADLNVALLGQFRLTYRGELVCCLNSPRIQSLFGYLMLHREAPTLRQHLAFQYWPDATESQALNNLRSLIHKLRHGLPAADSFLIADSLTVWLHPDAPIDLDIAHFEAATQPNAGRAELELAAQLYAGDLLPACYEDWLQPRREALNEQARAALGRLVDMLEETLEYDAAIPYANQLLRLDPLQETTYRTLMRLHALHGDRATALRTYHVCVTTLREELGVPPSKATQTQYQRLLAESPAEVATVQAAARLSLIGRNAPWSKLLSVWKSSANGKPTCAAVLGEAGIGKSRLVEELTNWVSRQGFTTAVARCYAAEGAPAYAPVIEWLHSPALDGRLHEVSPSVLTEVGRLRPDLLHKHPDIPRPSPLTADWQRQHLFNALSKLLLRQEHPLLLVLEDAQWCDATTLEWLHYLLRCDEHSPLLVVLTVRNEELVVAGPLQLLIGALRQTGQLVEISLEPLAAAETARLAQEVTRRPLAPDALATILRESEGHPLFAVELARLLSPGDVETRAVAPASLTRPQLAALPPRINAVLQSRLAQLSPSARELAGLAAAIGRQFTFAMLSTAFGQDEDTLVRNLDELWQRRIVYERGDDAYDFSHGKLRDAAYASLSAARRRLLHRRIGGALAPTPVVCAEAIAGVAASHYELAGDFASAVSCYRCAAEAATRIYANSDAVRFYQRAISLRLGLAAAGQTTAGEAGEEPHELYTQLARILHLLAHYDEARVAYEQALAYTGAGERVARSRILNAIGNTWREQYRYAEALAGYQMALDSLGKLPPENAELEDTAAHTDWRQWIQIQLDMSLVYYWLNQIDALDSAGARLEAAVERYGSTGQRAMYWQRKGSLAFRRNRSVSNDEILRCQQRSLDALCAGDDATALPAARFLKGFCLLWNNDTQDAIAAMNAALATAEQTGDVSLQARCLAYLAVAYRRLEERDQVEQAVQKCLTVAGAAHMPEYVGTAYANWVWLAWRAGDWTAAEQYAHEAFAAWKQLPPDHASLPFQWTCLAPLIAIAHHTAQLDKAVGYTRQLLDPLQQRLPVELTTAAELAVEAWEQGSTAQASRRIELLIDLARTHNYL